FAPLVAWAQVNPDSESAGSGESQVAHKYSVFAGGAYTRIRQVPASYSGLIGGKVTVARDWGRYFMLTGSVDYYKMGIGHSGIPNPGHPSVYSALAGPGVHMDLFAGLSGQLFAELGMEHTGSESMSPSTSFAGGFGGGVTYNFNPRWGLQLTGDRVGASFPLPGTAQQANSTHRTWNARGTMGIVYRF
ncbi:MAG: hypothetical protein ACRD3S_01755, partial [Terracidiphilus sp.]